MSKSLCQVGVCQASSATERSKRFSPNCIVYAQNTCVFLGKKVRVGNDSFARAQHCVDLDIFSPRRPKSDARGSQTEVHSLHATCASAGVAALSFRGRRIA
jgi:hypothetical protein